MLFRTLRVRKKILSFLTLVGLCIPALTSLCPSYAYADENQAIIEKYAREEKEREAAQIAEHKTSFIGELYQIRPRQFSMPTVLSPIEFNELNIGKLAGVSGVPITGVGYAGLAWLSRPVISHAEISRRQGIIRTLFHDESSFDQLRKALQNIKKGEDALIMYWNKESKLHEFIKSNVLPKKTKKPKKLSWIGEKQYALTEGMYGKERDKLYTTVPALEFAALSPLFNLVGLSLKSYISYCIWRKMVWQPMANLKDPHVWAQTCMPNKSMGEDMFKRVFADLWTPFSMKDRMQEENRPGVYKVWDGLEDKEVEKTLPEMGFLHGIQVPFWGTAKDRFIFGRDFAQYMFPGISDRCKDIAGVGLVASMALRYYFYHWGYFNICNIWKEGKELINKMHELHVSLVDIAKLMRTLKDLQTYVANTSVFNGSYAQAALELIMGNKSKASPEFKELMELLTTKTFDSADTFLYSRGRVLRAHILLKKVKYKELVPLLQAVAELDGYCTITRLMKAYEHQENKYVFAEFVNSDTPLMNISSCWEPLAPTKTPVVNDIRLGADGKPIRMIITGPNGGGKSTFLKSVGHAVVMAQSWGIVPASKAELTMFTALRTSLDPKEDLSAGISKFTAQKERIGSIQDLMKQSSAQSKMLVILDEPYTGTIDDQMADRVHAFGQKATQVPHTALCIATHVKKPIELARNGSFANYQIEILEPTRGQFVRTFKVKEGAAQWWFNDKPRVTRFIDWLNPANMRKNPGVEEQVASTQDDKKADTQPGKVATA